MSASSPAASLASSPVPLSIERYRQIRSLSERLCQPLAIEDYVIQTMEDISPPKWNLAHTSWFFETFLLKRSLPEYREFHPLYNYLFNSYYEAVGERHPRPERGMLSRPTVAEVLAYRRHVDEAMARLLAARRGRRSSSSAHRIGPQPRATAPGAAGHRLQAHIGPESRSSPGLSRSRSARLGGSRLLGRWPPGSPVRRGRPCNRATTGLTDSSSTARGPGTTCCCNRSDWLRGR